jgi:hypothetical protein
MKLRLGSKWIFVALIFGALVAVIAYTSSERKREYRAKISALTSEVRDHHADIGDLRQLLNEPRFQGLTLRQESPTEWIVETPSEFGAKNWILYVELSDSRITTLRVRTLDSNNVRPEGAPPDKTVQQ